MRGAQEIDGLADVPMLRRHNDLALHQTPCTFFGVSQRLFDSDAIGVFQGVQDCFLLWLSQIFDQIDHIVRIQIADSVGQLLGCELINDVFAQAFFWLGPGRGGRGAALRFPRLGLCRRHRAAAHMTAAVAIAPLGEVAFELACGALPVGLELGFGR